MLDEWTCDVSVGEINPLAASPLNWHLYELCLHVFVPHHDASLDMFREEKRSESEWIEMLIVDV